MRKLIWLVLLLTLKRNKTYRRRGFYQERRF